MLGQAMPWRRRGLVRVLVLCVTGLLLALTSVGAMAMRQIEPGKMPKLGADEGLVLLSVDTDTRVSNVQIGRAGGGTAEVLNYFDVGRTMRLYAGKAGEYEWSKVTLTTFNTRSVFDIAKPEFRFRIEPGKIVYPGELVMRPTSLVRSYIQVHNRSLVAMDWLETTFPALYRTMPFEYSGEYPDPFPAYYRAARERSTRTLDALTLAKAVKRPKPLIVAAEEMWQQDTLLALALSPSGRQLAISQRENEAGCTTEVIDVASGKRRCVSKSKFQELIWKDEKHLIGRHGGSLYTLYALAEGADGTLDVTGMPIGRSGRLVDPLPREPGAILFEGRDARGTLSVHRLAVAGGGSIEDFGSKMTRDRLNKGLANDQAWYTDGEGRLRVALASYDDDLYFAYGRDGDYKRVLRLSDGLEPQNISYDGSTLYALSDDGKTQRDLVSYDLATGQPLATLFSKPGVDLFDTVFDSARKPVGVRYYLSGRLVTEYFEDDDRAVDAWLQSAFQGRNVMAVDRSDDGRHRVVMVEDSAHPAQVYLADTVERRVTFVADVNPALSKKRFAPAYVIHAQSSDGLSVEAFLTLPESEGKRPLVVLPHGGPIGVSDTLHFDREVQYLAGQGYAVLQVNFRGSEGRGTAFREAGHRNYGKAIEDDIDAALRAALAEYPLDETRMCVVGASYGGYSALISAIRWPGRFRCAVSQSGISDRMLFFTASDSARWAKVREFMERVMGNPHTDGDDMMAFSPLYRTADLKLPVMLVHGLEDKRVDFEHTNRLVRMLNIEGNMPTVLAPHNMGHGPGNAFESVVAWSATVNFLDQYLKPQAATVPDADTPKVSGSQ